MKVLALIAALIVGACPIPEHLQGQLDQDLKVKHGHEVGIFSEHMMIAFTTLNAESRCPRSVTCVRAGEAKITIRVAKQFLATETRVLTIPAGQAGSDSAQYMGYTITLKALDPYPETPDKPEPESYEATIVVTKG